MKRMISSISALAILVFSLCICSCGKDEVMVAFAARGGEMSGKTSFEIEKGDIISNDEVPTATCSGKTFLYWAYDVEGQKRWYEDEPFFEDTTLYAVWKENNTITGIIDIEDFIDE